MTDREHYIYHAALAGDLDYDEVRTGGDAEWAANGYRERAENASLPLSDRVFAREFIANLDCDFS
jgi:hypothetical protein